MGPGAISPWMRLGAELLGARWVRLALERVPRGATLQGPEVRASSALRGKARRSPEALVPVDIPTSDGQIRESNDKISQCHR